MADAILATQYPGMAAVMEITVTCTQCGASFVPESARSQVEYKLRHGKPMICPDCMRIKRQAGALRAAQLNRRALKHFRLHEAQKTYAAAGNNNGQHWSPYKQTCLSILDYVRAHPGCCLRDLIQNIKHHYASRTSANQCVSYWAQAGKVPGVECRLEGKYLRFYEIEKTR
jgi:hypothetical protein